MRLPAPPAPERIEAITPTFFEAAIACKAKAAWTRFGDRRHVIDTPNALIGRAFHKVMEVAALGEFPPGDEAFRVAARNLFDDEAQRNFEQAHPLLRNRYPTKHNLPHYFLQRERAVAAALQLPRGALGPSTRASTPGERITLGVEQTVASVDGKLKGRIDWLNAAEHEIVDYKAGTVPDGQGHEVSDRERRQLSLYAYLAREHGVEIHRCTIIRSNGIRCSANITQQEAEDLAEEARRVLADYNRAIGSGASFDDMAQPSKEACWFCPCIPFCRKFWETSKEDWAEFQGFGWHIQGTVTAVSSSDLQGLNVLTMTLSHCSGTGIANDSTITIDRIPSSWICVDPAQLPKEGDLLRVIHGRKAYPGNAVVFRADKDLSTVWRVEHT